MAQACGALLAGVHDVLLQHLLLALRERSGPAGRLECGDKVVQHHLALLLVVHQREYLLALRVVDVVAVADRDARHELVHVEADAPLLLRAELAEERRLRLEAELWRGRQR